MKIIYSDHLKNRLSVRKIEHELPKRIFEQSKEKYFDKETGHLVATMKVKLYGRIRDVMVAYDIEGDAVTLITIHPVKPKQKANLIKTGRWRKL